MASGELFIDLEYRRYAEIPVTAARPESTAAAELLADGERDRALQRLRLRAMTDDVVDDLLTVLGLAG